MYECQRLLWWRVWEPVDDRDLSPLVRLKLPRRFRWAFRDLLEPMGEVPHLDHLLSPESLLLFQWRRDV